MGYDLHITRAEFHATNEGHEITAEEWLRYVQSDPELRLFPCRDWYHAKLPGGVDPDLYSVRGTPNGDGTSSRVRRGGAWGDDGWACRSALRLRYEPPRGADHIGFRVGPVRQW